MLRRLNGWQRLGLLASIAWFVGMWVYVTNVQDKQYWEDWGSTYRMCRDKPHDLSRDFEQSKECQAEASTFADMMCCNGVNAEDVVSGKVSWGSWFLWRNQNQIAVAVLMIPLGWLLVYVCIWLARWVKRGFAKSS